jgi:hypothetical protein
MTPLRLIIAALVLIACFGSCNMIDARPEAESLADKYFTSRITGNLEETLSLYGDAFFKETPRSQWIGILDAINRQLGVPLDHSLISWKIWVGHGSAGAGTYVDLDYDVNYSRYPAYETLVFFTPLLGGSPRIFSHSLDCPDCPSD